jgi:RNA polymerase sigma factor (sigma-70 family)
VQDVETEIRFNSILTEYGQLLRKAIEARLPRYLGLDFDDVMQEVRLKLWHTLRHGREIRYLPAYLHKIAATVTIDAVRRIKARREEPICVSSGHACEPDEIMQTTDDKASPEFLAGQQHLAGMIMATLGRLPADRRTAVGLYLQGWNTVQIAELTGWTEARARNLVYRGLDHLRRQLRTAGYEYEVE